MEFDAVIVGGGVAGLTAAAFLAKAGKRTLVCEKEAKCGGLVNNFERDGFTYDGGIRALEDSGVLFPMLRQLGIEIDFVPNKISVGIEDKIIAINEEDAVEAYRDLLVGFYPENGAEIDAIMEQIRLIMHYMDVQYGIDNPLFLDIKTDRDYFIKEIFPWMFKYAFTAPKIARMNTSTLDFLRKYTQNQSLLDIITQHFFQETPAFFALSYLKLYLEYHYPLGGTGQLITKLVDFIQAHQGEISTNTLITEIDTDKHIVKDSQGRTISYQRLIWAADQQALYRLVQAENIANSRVRQAVRERQALIEGKAGNDSIYTLFVGVDLDKQFFAEKTSAHSFYTPSRIGQSAAGPLPIGQSREAVEAWLERFLALTTYEISIPALRDSSMAPEGKTGLIISVLFDYKLTKYVEEQGWYEDFKTFCQKRINSVLNESLFPGFADAILHVISSTPLTMARLTNNHEGAITGWSFTNRPVPAESRIPRIVNAAMTPIPGVYQAGQWTYSPSGLPVSLLTGKVAADKVIKDLKKR